MIFQEYDKKRIYDERYFFSSVIDGNHARMVSKNTLDSWIIEMKEDYCILYHDHPGNIQYHEHRRFLTFNEALQEIKSHDRYVLNKRKKKNYGKGSL